MSDHALSLLAEGLSANTKLTDFFFTHNNLRVDPENCEASLALIRSFSNKLDLKSLAINSCNLGGELLEALRDSI